MIGDEIGGVDEIGAGSGDKTGAGSGEDDCVAEKELRSLSGGGGEALRIDEKRGKEVGDRVDELGDDDNEDNGGGIDL